MIIHTSVGAVFRTTVDPGKLLPNIDIIKRTK